MRLRLDTHVFVWSVIDSRQLKAATPRYLASAEIVYMSVASIWEIEIKTRLGKMTGDAEAFAAASTTVTLRDYAGSIRQITITDLGHEDPTILVTPRDQPAADMARLEAALRPKVVSGPRYTEKLNAWVDR
jgi:PIN domain nuclease of toxin-antitoxin system